MKKTTNKILSALIAASMILGMVSTATVAAEPDTESTDATVQETAVDEPVDEQEEPVAEEAIAEEPVEEQKEESSEQSGNAEAEEPAQEEVHEEPAGEQEAVPADVDDQEEASAVVVEEQQETAVNMPAQKFKKSVKAADINNKKTTVTVVVDAPEGALPEKSGMTVAAVGANDLLSGSDLSVLETVKEMTEDDVVNLITLDITFTDADGYEINPAVPVDVTIKTSKVGASVAAEEDFFVAYIDKDNDAELIEETEIDQKTESVLFEQEESGLYVITQRADHAFFEQQPEDQLVVKNGTAVFTAMANLPYTSCQWQYSKDGGSSWKNLSQKTYGSTDTLSFKVKSSHDGYQYRCVVTLTDKRKITSDAARLSIDWPAILEQPKNTAVAAGDTASFEVAAHGEIKSCQWQYSKNGGSSWKNLSVKTYGNTPSLSFRMKKSYDGYMYRCRVDFTDGSKLYSEGARLNILTMPAVELNAGDGNAAVTIDAGEGALPEGTSLDIETVDTAEVGDVSGLVENGNVLYAADISLEDRDGDSVEPAKNVSVSLTVDGADWNENCRLVHINDDGSKELIQNAVFDGNKVSFRNDTFSVYAVVEIDGAVDYEMTLGSSKVTVKAPEGAFEPGTTMVIESVEPEDLLKLVTELGTDQTYAFTAVNISFYKDGNEVEPREAVEVTWESAGISADDEKLVHLKDDGSVETVKGAVISDGKVRFSADSFSTYTTVRQDSFTLEGHQIVFRPQSMYTDTSITLPETMNSGDLSETHPEFEGYTFVNATYEKNNEISNDPVVYLGAFLYSDDEVQNKLYIYYRTESTASDSDMIVRLAEDETIHLNYQVTPFKVTYKVLYNGNEYIIGQDDLPAELKGLVVTGPASVAADTTYEEAVKVNLPRGYSASVKMSNESSAQAPALGEGSEPTYTCTDGWTVTPADNTFTIDGTYTIANVTEDLTVTVDLSKRTSYHFSATPAFSTAYFGGRQGDVRRYTTNNPLESNFNSNSHTFTFTTAYVSSGRYQWVMDSFNINKETINVPYVNADNTTDTVTTVLTSGTTVTLSAQYHANNSTRTYTLTVSDCYENITITGGNLHGSGDHDEWVVQETTNMDSFQYLASDWLDLTPGEPMTFTPAYYAVGTGPDPTAAATHYYWSGGYNYQAGYYRVGNAPNRGARGTHYQSYKERVIRFKVAEGYCDPKVKYITQENTDQYTRVFGIDLDANAENGYHLVTSEPDSDGYYYFTLFGTLTDPGLLSVRAELARYGVSYDKGAEEINATIPEFDEGGRYGDGTLKGYNIADNPYVVVADSAPVDNGNQYIFMYYTIDGDTSGTRYAPSQKIPLEDISGFAEYSEEKGEYVIPFVAHWEEITAETPINMTVKIFVDDVDTKDVITVVPKNSAVYVDIDSQAMVEFMDLYNWQLFYDEGESSPFINEVNEQNNSVEIRLYSKFYIYHSSTGNLELHTFKELETGTGDNRTINNSLDMTGLVESGYYYGGYYTDYKGAYNGSTNLIKAAADDNNENGTLSTTDIMKLSSGDNVVIASGIAPSYRPDQNASQVSNWARSSAFTTVLKTADSSWCGDRGPDTEALTTGGTGTSVKVARAGIYCLHEVPGAYLASPKAAVVKDNYGQGDITSIHLISVADITIFRTGGIKINNTDKKGTFAGTFSLVQYNQGTKTYGTPDPKDSKWFNAAGGHLIVVEGSSCMADGSYTLEPYWITYDNVKIYGGSSHTRTLTVSGNTVE